MRLDNVSLIKLLPRFMREDDTAQALCKAIENELQGVNNNALEFLYSLLIDNAPEWFLDQMAWEENITWYDIDADIEAKRNIIRNAPWIKYHLGTKAAVEITVADYFGEATVEEWFEYSGNPFHFRVMTTPKAADDMIYQFRKAVENTKNVRSYLEAIITLIKAHQPQYAAITTTHYERQAIPVPGLSEAGQYAAVVPSGFEIQTIKIPGLEGM